MSDKIFTPGFNLRNLSAKANGMGGAFIGLADDATFACVKHANLILAMLHKTEISINGNPPNSRRYLKQAEVFK